MSATAATASVEAALAHGMRMLERDPLLAAEKPRLKNAFNIRGELARSPNARC